MPSPADCQVAQDFETLYHNHLLPYGDAEISENFLKEITDLMTSHIIKSNNRDEKVLNFVYPEKLEKFFKDYKITEKPLSLQKIIDDCKMIMELSVKTAHPRCFNQLFSGLDWVSLAGEMITAACNTSMYTYEMAPAFNCLEKLTIEKMASMCGWTEPCDGLFNPGGSISNLYSVQAAMNHFFPNVKQEGVYGMPKIIAFTSKHCHYSMQRAVVILGLGTDSLRLVPVDEQGRMIPAELEKMVLICKEKNEVPFFVNATSGTTVLGAYDPIVEVNEVCKKHNMWLHIDAAWGGGALLSKKHKHLLKGIEEADSVTWNPHKMMGTLNQCSAFLCKKKDLLSKCNKMNATYLFQQDKLYDVSYDSGDKTLQCGRHVDVLKCWLMWRSKGDIGFENHINHLFHLAELLHSEVKRREDFDYVIDNPECTNVCFWYIPKSLKHLDRNSEEFKEKIHKVAPQIKAGMMLNGTMMIGYQPLDTKPNFFRMVFNNYGTRDEDVHFLLDEIERLGKDP